MSLESQDGLSGQLLGVFLNFPHFLLNLISWIPYTFPEAMRSGM